MPIVRFEDVECRYPNGVTAVSGLTLSVDPGEVVVLVGRSGAGKSTILKLVNRMVLPQSGSVFVEGRDTREWDSIQLRRRTGYVLQDIGLLPHMTVEENVGLVPRLERWSAIESALVHTSCSILLAFHPRSSLRAGPPNCREANASAWAWPGPSRSIRRFF